MAEQVQVVDSLSAAATPSKHRNHALRTIEFFTGDDPRRIRLTFSRHRRDAYYSPRHRHNFDQVRFLVSGQVRYGGLLTRAGDCTYFPEGVPYGPTTVVSEESVTCTIQTQGPSWALVPTQAEADAAADELAAIGEMDRATGRFHWPNGKVQDSYEAIWERVAGERLVYPRARYQAPCLVRSAAFEWEPAAGLGGVAVKRLACFNASGPALTLVRLAPGAAWAIAPSEGHQVAAVLEGEASCASVRGGAGTFVYCPPNGPRAEVVAEQETVLLLTRLQARSSPVAASWVA